MRDNEDKLGGKAELNEWEKAGEGNQGYIYKYLHTLQFVQSSADV